MQMEIRASCGYFYLTYSLAEVQPFAMFRRRCQQSLQPPAQVRRFTDVGLAIAAQSKDCCARRELRKEALVAVRRECQGLCKHFAILVGSSFERVVIGG